MNIYMCVYVYRYVQSQSAFGEGVTNIYQKEWKDGKGMKSAAWWDALFQENDVPERMN
jgi:hypothetical protein